VSHWLIQGNLLVARCLGGSLISGPLISGLLPQERWEVDVPDVEDFLLLREANLTDVSPDSSADTVNTGAPQTVEFGLTHSLIGALTNGSPSETVDEATANSHPEITNHAAVADVEDEREGGATSCAIYGEEEVGDYN